MKLGTPYLTLLSLLLLGFSGQSQDFSITPNKGQLVDMSGDSLPLYEYYLQAGPISTYFKSNGYDVVYRRPDTTSTGIDSVIRINMHFGQTDAMPAFTTGDSSDYVINYYLPYGDTNNTTGLRQYSSIAATGIYPGITVTYENKNPGFGIRFTIDTSQAPETIELVFTGQESISIDTSTGVLQIETKLDPLFYTMPTAWQSNGLVDATYDVDSNEVVRFDVSNYQQDEDLHIEIGQLATIDEQCEGNLTFSTYLGGESTHDLVRDLIIEEQISKDAMYVGGEFGSPSIPNLSQTGNVLAFDDLIDGYVAAIDIEEDEKGVLVHTLQWLTYYGTEGVDRVKAVEYGRSGSFVYAAGEVNGFDLLLRRPNTSMYWDVRNNRRLFMARFNENTGRMNWSTYFGGTGADKIHDMEMNQADEIYVVGHTPSTDFPLVDNGNGSYYKSTTTAKGFISVFDNHQDLLHSTRFGVSQTVIHAVALNYEGSQSSSVYITGETNGNEVATGDFLVKEVSTGFDNVTNSYGGGDLDAFITKFHPDDAAGAKMTLIWSSFMGGSATDKGFTIDVADVDIYVGGSTGSSNFPIEQDNGSGAFNQTTKYGQADGFIGRFTKQGEQEYTTYFGSDASDEVRHLVADGSYDDVYFFGNHSGLNGPQTINDVALTGGWNQATPSSNLPTEVSIGWLKNDNSLGWATYFGGEQQDEVYSGDRSRQDYFVIGGLTRTSQTNLVAPNEFPLCNHLPYFSESQVVNDPNVEYGFLSTFDMRGQLTNVDPLSELPGMSVYPTLTNGLIWIKAGNYFANNDLVFTIVNSIGQQVLTGNLTGRNQSFDLSMLPSGIYIVIVNDGNGVQFSEKILKAK